MPGLRKASLKRQYVVDVVLQHAFDRNRAVAESDIVITATPGLGPVFDLEYLQPGTHLNCVGTDTQGKRELPEGLFSALHGVC